MRLGVGLHIEIDDIVPGARHRGPDLLAVDPPFIAVAHRRSAHRADIRAGVGLRHRDREFDLAAEQLRQPVALLLLGRLAHQVEAAKDIAAIGHHQIGAGARDLLGDDCHVDDAAAGAAIFLGERQRDQAGFDPGLIELFRVGALAVVLSHIVRRRVLLHQLAHRLAQQPLFLAESEIHDVSR
jgi:hypothetical protein